MCRPPRRPMFVLGLMLVALVAAPSQSVTSSTAPVLVVNDLGIGTAALDGPWQFHLGDNPAWALPNTGDDQSNVGWEQLSPSKTWGEQGHPSYTGFAWYRKHIRLKTAPGASPDVALLIPRVDDAYEIYWNGVLVGQLGTLSPRPSWPIHPPEQTFGLGPIREGVLALRVWKAPLDSFDPDSLGGLSDVPLVGSPSAVAARKAELDYAWLRGQQFRFGLNSLYGLLMILSLLGWMRDRSQKVLFWMAVFSGSSLVNLVLLGLRIPFSAVFAVGWIQPVFSLYNISLWFLLLYLLKLDENPTLARLTRLLAIISFSCFTLDGLLALFWTDPLYSSWAQLVDAALTGVNIMTQPYPLVLVAFALRKHLDHARWLVALFAFLAGMLSMGRVTIQQGSRYTHWTLGNKIGAPLFTINGNAFSAETVASSLLLLAIIYGVYRYLQESSRLQNKLDQEIRSARELQRVLMPEAIPPIPGFALTSSYLPAQEVGGDFFQVIPLDGEFAGSTLVILGDVSGKGLKAAMAVSLIVGAARAIVRFTPHPAEILSELNERLRGHLQEGFATCLVMRLDSGGQCVISNAGHPAPFLNTQELDLPGALPLGIAAATRYEVTTVDLREGDHFALYTDGLLEARRTDGEIFSFERLEALLAERPDAAKATEAAVSFGQDDDITVLTFTRLGSGEESTTTISMPKFADV